MSDLRYNRAFTKALYGIFICIILFGSIIVFFIISKLQYDQLVSDMKPMNTTKRAKNLKKANQQRKSKRNRLNWKEKTNVRR